MKPHLHAYGFNHDHLYRFFYPNHLNLTEVALYPDLDGGPHANMIQIGNLGAEPGYHMVYNYDFLEDWLFDVELISISKDAFGHPRYRLGSRRGDAPDQYHGRGDGWLF